MKVAGYIAAFAAGIGCFALAIHFMPSAGSTWRDRPPVRYQGDGVAGVVFTTEGGVQSMCPAVGYAIGCTVGSTIYVPNPCRWRDPYATLLCHELGHVNGWSALHER